MKLHSELRRRKVYQSVGLYLAAAWLILQVAESVTELWGSPPWVLQSLFLLLLAGLPVVAVISWLFDLSGGALVPTPDSPTPPWRRVIGSVLAMLAVVLLLAAYLWPDEPLSEDVRRLRATLTSVDNDALTLDYGLYGFNAPAGSDFWQHGRYLVNGFNGLGHMPPEPDAALEFTVSRDGLCRLREPACRSGFAAEAAGIAPLLEANAELLRRYFALRESRSFANVIHVHFESPLPAYRNLIISQSLVARDLARREPVAAAAGLAEEIAFHRVILAESQSVVAKMIAVVLLEEDLRLYALLATPMSAPARLSLPERSFVAPFRWEAVGMLNSLEVARDDIAPLPYLPNRTANLLTAPMVFGAQASLLPPAEFVTRRAEYSPPTPSVGEWFANTSGALLMNASPDFLTYVGRVQELDALIVLAQVARRAREEGVDTGTVSAWLHALPPDLRNPFDGHPPVWSDGVLSFPPDPERPPRFPLELDLPLPAITR